MFLGRVRSIPKTTTDCSSRVCTNSLMNSDTKEHTNVLWSKTIVEQFSGIFRHTNHFSSNLINAHFLVDPYIRILYNK